MARIRVLVADSHRIFAEALATALAAEPDVDVAAAGSGHAALRALDRAAAENRPFHVLLVDADLAPGSPSAPPSGGITAAAAPRRVLPPPQRPPLALPAQRQSSLPGGSPRGGPVPPPPAGTRPSVPQAPAPRGPGIPYQPPQAPPPPAAGPRIPAPRGGAAPGVRPVRPQEQGPNVPAAPPSATTSGAATSGPAAGGDPAGTEPTQDPAGGPPGGPTGGPPSDGVAMVGCVRAVHPAVRVVVLAATDDPGRVVQALTAGASGWVAKESSLGRLMAVVRGVLREETHVPPLLLTAVIRELTAARRDRTESERLVESLTPREKQVLRCMVAGLGRQAVADRLYLSPHTVRTHMQNVLGKLGVHSTLAAVAVARRAGVGPAD